MTKKNLSVAGALQPVAKPAEYYVHGMQIINYHLLFH